jgi:anaerobic selenocysteine-containing dehydrogenase
VPSKPRWTNRACAFPSTYWYWRPRSVAAASPPVRTPEAKAADLWLPIRPGTDAALAMGLINIIIRENLYAADFVAEHTSGLELSQREPRLSTSRGCLGSQGSQSRIFSDARTSTLTARR